MKNLNNQLDITKNIKKIEILKCQILNSVADLHTTLINSSEKEEKLEIFSNLIILIYILAKKLDITPTELEDKIIKKLKLGVLDENNDFNDEIKEIYRFFN